MTAKMLVVVGSVPAKKYAPIRHEFVRDGISVTIVRVKPDAFSPVFDAVKEELDEVEVEAYREELTRRTAERLINGNPEDVLSIIFSEQAYEQLDDPVVFPHRVTLTDSVQFFPNLVSGYVVHPDWIERNA